MYWISTSTDGRLATMQRPSGGEQLAAELAAIRAAGVDTLVALIASDEAKELGLGAEADLARAAGLDFRPFPIPDFTTPPLDAVTAAFVADLADRLRSGATVAIHCRMGIGRSSLIAASVLGVLGVDPAEALARISAARGCPVPDTDAQRDWVVRFVQARLWEGSVPS